MNTSSTLLDSNKLLCDFKSSKELHTYPQTSDLSNGDFFVEESLDNYGSSPINPFNSANAEKGEFQFFFDDNNNYGNNNLDLEGICSNMANTSDHIFKFPNLGQISNIGEPLELTGITQNDNQFQSGPAEINFDTCQADCDFGDENQPTKASMKLREDKDQKPASSVLPRKDIKCKPVRRDVINKTIFRIIRRYFHMLLEKAVPDYKSQKRTNLLRMLASFAEFLFPNIDNSYEMSKVMSALMFRREVLVSHKEICQDSNLKVFLDIQSKYSHKLLSPALHNEYFRIMFSKFIEEGLSFLDKDENVMNNSKIYYQELEKIKSIFESCSSAGF